MMNLDKETYKKVTKAIKSEIKNEAKAGGQDQRHRLLAYGFIRGLPYRVIEPKINEDKFGPLGLSSFLSGLCYYIEMYICSGHSFFSAEQISELRKNLNKDIAKWLSTNEAKQEEAA